MLRLSDQGVPPHMLHLYQPNSAQKPKKTELHDDAIRLPNMLIKLSNHVLARLRSLRVNKTDDTFVPDSAKHTSEKSRETQYLGETPLRDTRWTAP